MRRPFTLYKEPTKSGTIWYARFWDETAGKYNRSRSTGVLVEGKKKRLFEAEKAARKLYIELAARIPTVPKTPANAPTSIPANIPTPPVLHEVQELIRE